MNQSHYLYPLPHLERYPSPSHSIDIPKDLRRTLSALKPQIAWSKKRLWPVEGPHKPTKREQKIKSDAQWEIYQQQVNRERAAAKEVCERMTIQEAWTCLQSHLHTNQYEVESMSEADWDVYQHAKDLLNNHIKSLNDHV